MKSLLLVGMLFLAGCCCVADEDVMTVLPEPVAAPVAQAVERDFIIYFAFDKSDLTDASQAVVDEIAAYTQDLDGASVSLRGHTDSSGSNDYNAGLSERRAGSVSGALADKGVGYVGSSWAGESELAVPTEDGVREPLNRRVNVRVGGTPTS